jgi:cytochrome c553
MSGAKPTKRSHGVSPATPCEACDVIGASDAHSTSGPIDVAGGDLHDSASEGNVRRQLKAGELMKRLLRWFGIALGSLAAFGIIAYAVVYVLSERVLRRTYQVSAVAISIPTDPASITEGRRLATIRGCFSGCHGKQAEGVVMFDEPMIGRVVAPNLTAAVRKYSDAELVATIRNGVRPGGRSMMVMPAEAFVGLTDEDLGRIIAFLKSLPAVAGPDSSVALGPLGRIGVAIGKFKTAAQLIAETVPPPVATSDEAAYGRYLARTTCSMPRDKPGRRFQSRFHQSEPAGSGCLFAGIIRSTIANGRGARGKEA